MAAGLPDRHRFYHSPSYLTMEDPIVNTIAGKLQVSPSCLTFRPVGGGSINLTFRLDVSGHPTAFCKLNSASKFPHLFEKEADGLESIKQQQCILTPNVLHTLAVGNHQVLLLEWIPAGERTTTFWKTFGQQLARLHQCTAESFGWKENNYMGSLPQQNHPSPGWTTFFQEQRLHPLIEQDLHQSLLQTPHLKAFEQLYKKLPHIFDPEEKPALLHGDLWSGNFMCNAQSLPVLIDPAVYYGHRSMDLGMTTLFGGFRQEFYEAYQYHYPLPHNAEEQWQVCNLYPLLIHLILFGSSYLPQIEFILNSFR
jgi:protein-ribulosamine 3-kinase